MLNQPVDIFRRQASSGVLPDKFPAALDSLEALGVVESILGHSLYLNTMHHGKQAGLIRVLVH